ncbi:hypothetical protein [uncultured Maritimibacter sp.]|uniref:Acb2/Tad1 domain-containing protein n=1 Tax=uncultured Maritimibacter sp. TaxID=991866 RepID=UPI002596A84B|nr:hypothetical protein [uncultured Maritimibacter sp.]
MAMTKGEYRVGIDFNPSNDDMVGQIKRKAADLIDLIETIPMEAVVSTNAEVMRQTEVVRLKALAQTEIESAAMWAVKAATKPAKA